MNKGIWILSLVSSACFAQDYIVILMYHHVATNTPPTTSIDPERFIEHLDLIDSLGLTVVDLVDALHDLSAGKPLPNGAIALTFDDAWQSVYHNAHPILRERQLNYSILVPTQATDQRRPLSLNWDQLRELHQQGVRILNHSHDHGSLAFKNQESWLEDALANVELAQQRLEEELDTTASKIVAYPYGEYNLQLADALAEKGYWALGQHSGGFSANMHWQSIPRFPLDGVYANPNTARVKMASRPLPLIAENRIEPLQQQSPPTLTLAVDTSAVDRESLRCFWRDQTLIPHWLDEGRFQVSAPESFSGRSRYNCTASFQGQTLWFSQPWLISPPD